RVPAADGAAQGLRATWSSVLADLTPTGAAWLGAVAATLAAVMLLRTDRTGNVARTAFGVGAYLTALHLMLALILLPRLTARASARPQAERLGRVAEEGVALLAFGNFDSQALSPILFYARHDVAQIGSVGALVMRLRNGPACALIRPEDYADLAGVLPGSPVRDVR